MGKTRSIVALAFGLAALGGLAAPAMGQSYPSRPVTMVLPFGPGSGGDLTARSYVPGLQEELKQQIVVENRPGHPTIGINAVAKAAPDGYTIGFWGGDAYTKVFGPEWPNLLEVVSPIIQLQRGAFFLISSTDIPATNAREFINFVRANPGKHNYAGVVPTQYIPMEMIKHRWKLDLVQVRYKSIAEVNNAFLRGEIIGYISNPSGIESAIAQKKVRFLAYLDAQRNPYYPDVPSAEEAGLGDLKSQFTLAAWGPHGLPPEIVARLNAAFNNTLKRPDVQKFARTQGAVLVGGAASVHYDYIKQTHAFWEEAVRVTGVKIN